MSAAVVATLNPESNESTEVIERYAKGYRIAEKVFNFGESVAMGGIFLGGVLVVGAMVELLMNPAERYGFPLVFVSMIACGVLLALVSQLPGMGFRGLGQLLKAAVDADVNSSPFLSNAQRAKAMSLRKRAAVAEQIRWAA